jgi:hypothetical protein
MQPRVNYPAAQIVNSATAPMLATSSSQVVLIPPTSAGGKPAFIRIAISAGAAFVNCGQNTSTTATTADTIVTASEALWLNTIGYGAVAFLQTAPGGAAFGSVDACEEGALAPSGQPTPGLG